MWYSTLFDRAITCVALWPRQSLRKGRHKSISPQGSGFQKWKQTQVSVLHEFTPSNTRSWQVTTLDLSANRLSELPSAIGGCVSLIHFKASNNRLTEGTPSGAYLQKSENSQGCRANNENSDFLSGSTIPQQEARACPASLEVVQTV